MVSAVSAFSNNAVVSEHYSHDAIRYNNTTIHYNNADIHNINIVVLVKLLYNHNAAKDYVQYVHYVQLHSAGAVAGNVAGLPAYCLAVCFMHDCIDCTTATTTSCLGSSFFLCFRQKPSSPFKFLRSVYTHTYVNLKQFEDLILVD
jgi:hypothetical protein